MAAPLLPARARRPVTAVTTLPHSGPPNKITRDSPPTLWPTLHFTTSSATPDCGQCDGMPLVAPILPASTYASVTATAIPPQTTEGGLSNLNASTNVGPGTFATHALPGSPWYAQPWTIPATFGLMFYGVLSVTLLLMLISRGLLDWRLNYYPNRRSRIPDFLDLWEIEEYHVATLHQGQHSQWVASLDSATIHMHRAGYNYDGQLPQSTNERPDSVAETMIDYEELPDDGSSATPAAPPSAGEMPRARLRANNIHQRRQQTSFEGAVPHASAQVLDRYRSRTRSTGRFSTAQGGDLTDSQLAVWRRLELEMLHERIRGAGYF